MTGERCVCDHCATIEEGVEGMESALDRAGGCVIVSVSEEDWWL